ASARHASTLVGSNTTRPEASAPTMAAACCRQPDVPSATHSACGGTPEKPQACWSSQTAAAYFWQNWTRSAGRPPSAAFAASAASAASDGPVASRAASPVDGPLSPGASAMAASGGDPSGAAAEGGAPESPHACAAHRITPRQPPTTGDRDHP